MPCKNTAGLAVLLSAAAEYYQSATPTLAQISDPTFQGWLQPVADDVPNFAPLGMQPAAALAINGASVADFALLPESEWLTYYNRIAAHQPIQFAYPAYKVVFDMPLAVWSGPDASPDQQNAIKAFGDFLSQTSAQQQAISYGLRPTNLTLVRDNAPLFAAASGAGITLNTPPGTVVVMPERSGAAAILNWFNVIRAC
jgi:hypothetical protein